MQVVGVNPVRTDMVNLILVRFVTVDRDANMCII